MNDEESAVMREAQKPSLLDSPRPVPRFSTPADPLEAALDDIDGLSEASLALADGGRRSRLLDDKDLAAGLRRELAAAAGVYATTLISTARGDFNDERLQHCRSTAMQALHRARKRRKALAELVMQKRLPNPAVRDDLRQLVTLSLHCRGAIDALGPTVDKRDAEALGNKVLVELRSATLAYLEQARQAGDGSTLRARAVVAPLIEKVEARAKELGALAPETGGGSGDTLGVSLSQELVAALHGTYLGWLPNEDQTHE